MSNLTRTNPPPNRGAIQPKVGPGNKTKVLLVRQPVKSVRPGDAANPMPLRLAIGVIAALGALAVIWLAGFVGFRLGFASVLGVHDLQSEPGFGLATGAMIVVNAPMRVFEAGVADPMLLMLAFALIAIPGGGLAGVRSPTPGGPKPSKLFTLFTWTGAIAACLAAAATIAWIISPLRTARLSPLPVDLTTIDAWLDGWTIVAGLDALVALSAALWVVLAMRLRLPAWMKGLSVSAMIVALIVAIAGTSITNAVVAHLRLDRSLVAFGEGDPAREGQLLVGSTPRHAVVLRAVNAASSVEMFDVPTECTVLRRQSIAGLLLDAMPRDDEF
jgi:hypothetical protein